MKRASRLVQTLLRTKTIQIRHQPLKRAYSTPLASNVSTDGIVKCAYPDVQLQDVPLPHLMLDAFSKHGEKVALVSLFIYYFIFSVIFKVSFKVQVCKF